MQTSYLGLLNYIFLLLLLLWTFKTFLQVNLLTAGLLSKLIKILMTKRLTAFNIKTVEFE